MVHRRKHACGLEDIWLFVVDSWKRTYHITVSVFTPHRSPVTLFLHSQAILLRIRLITLTHSLPPLSRSTLRIPNPSIPSTAPPEGPTPTRPNRTPNPPKMLRAAHRPTLHPPMRVLLRTGRGNTLVFRHHQVNQEPLSVSTRG